MSDTNTTAGTPARELAGDSPERVVSAYLEAFYAGHFDIARCLVADDLSFKGPFVQVDSADALFASAKPLQQIVKGHRPIKQWRDGDEISTLYEMNLETPAGNGSVLVSEWNTVRDGKVTSATLVFDTAAFRSLVPQPQATS